MAGGGAKIRVGAYVIFENGEKKSPFSIKKYGETCGQGLVLFTLDITKCPLASIHTEITKKCV